MSDEVGLRDRILAVHAKLASEGALERALRQLVAVMDSDIEEPKARMQALLAYLSSAEKAALIGKLSAARTAANPDDADEDHPLDADGVGDGLLTEAVGLLRGMQGSRRNGSEPQDEAEPDAA
jgi:hypothetical protein